MHFLQNIVAAVLFIDTIMVSIIEVADAICNVIPENICVVVCGTNPAKILCNLIELVLVAIQKVFEGMKTAMDLHDGVVDGAEIEATLVNTEQIINWTCRVEQYMTDEFTDLQQAILDSENAVSLDVTKTEMALETASTQKVEVLRSFLNSEVSTIEGRLGSQLDVAGLQMEARAQTIKDLLA